MGKAAKVRELILSIAEDAWCSPPLLPEQAKELWDCIWMGSDNTLGGTYVASATQDALQDAAIAAGCWWVWTRNGEEIYLPLNAASARFASKKEPIDDTTAISTLESMRDTSSGDERRALEWAIARLRDQH